MGLPELARDSCGEVGNSDLEPACLGSGPKLGPFCEVMLDKSHLVYFLHSSQ